VEEELIDDPLFGTGPLPQPLMYQKTSRGLYAPSFHSFSRKHIEMKLDYLPLFLSEQISNPELVKGLKEVRQKFSDNVREMGKEHHQLIYSDVEAIYRNDAELAQMMGSLAEVLKGSSVRDCIEFSCVLSNDLLYFMDILPEAPLWDTIEEQLDFNLHILSFEEKAKAMFGLTHKFPKKGSFDLRDRLEKSLLNTNLDTLSPEKAMMFSTATRHQSGRDFCHYKYFDYVMQNAHIINQAPMDSTLPLDILYTFFNNRKHSRKRRYLRFENEPIEEELNLLELFSGSVLERIPSLPVSGLFRVLAILSVAKISGYGNLKMSILLTIKRRLNEFDPDVLVEMLKIISQFNHGVGIGDIGFWDSIQAHIEKNITHILQNLNTELQFTLLRILGGQNRLTREFFDSHFKERALELLSNEETQWEALFSLTQAYTRLYLQDQENPPIPLKHFVKSLLFGDKYWKLKHHYFFQIFFKLIQYKNPSWNLESSEYFSYHSNKEFNIWKLKESSMTPEIKEIITIVQSKLEMQILPLVDFENSFLIDMANFDYRFAIFVRSNSNTLPSQRSLTDIDSNSSDRSLIRDIQFEILKTAGWHIYELDYSEFLSHKNTRADWLLQELESEFAKAMENTPDPGFALRADVDNYIDGKGGEELEFPATNLEKLYKDKYYEMMDNFEKYLAYEIIQETLNYGESQIQLIEDEAKDENEDEDETTNQEDVQENST
jgi:hypothetical protein